MSLLLEALKQAEREHRRSGGRESPSSGGPSSADAGEAWDFELLDQEADRREEESAVPEPEATPEVAIEPESETAFRADPRSGDEPGTSGRCDMTAGQEDRDAAAGPSPVPLQQPGEAAPEAPVSEAAQEAPIRESPSPPGPDETAPGPDVAARLIDASLQRERRRRALVLAVSVLLLLTGLFAFRFLSQQALAPVQFPAPAAAPEDSDPEPPAAPVFAPISLAPLDTRALRPMRLSAPGEGEVAPPAAGDRGKAAEISASFASDPAPVPGRHGEAEISMPENSGPGKTQEDAQGERVEVSVRVRERMPDPRLSEAYARLQAGDLASARARYLELLADSPDNPDALLGLASVALASGDREGALELYRRVLAKEPDNPYARKGLLLAGGSPESHEAIEDPSLLFALASLHARENQWERAQALYFRAHAADPDNAAYLYGLAVSLDHLGKRELALRYYRQVLESGKAPVASSAVRRRIASLAAGSLEERP